MAIRQRSRTNVGYGLDNPLQSLAPQPIISKRSPTVSDTAAVGTIWINKTSNLAWILTSIAAGSANWLSI